MRDDVEAILDVAARAPSGTNMQPWRVHALAGAPLAALSAAVEASFRSGVTEARDYRYYPEPLFEPYLARRREVGFGLYALLGIGRGETDKMADWHVANLRFFGAPVALMVTIDRRLEIGSWLDLGMFLQNIMVAARGRGLDTCPQAIFAQYAPTVRAALGLGDENIVVCGMALGHADSDAPANALVSTRAAAGSFTTFAGF